MCEKYWARLSGQMIRSPKVCVLTLLLLGFCTLSAIAQDGFDEYQAMQELEYARYQENQELALAQFIDSVTLKWNEYKSSTRRVWYEYSQDLNTLSQVDFETGEVTIETLVPSDNPDVVAKAGEAIAAQVRRLHDSDEVTGVAILADQLKNTTGNVVDSTDVEEFVRDVVVPATKVSSEPLVSADGVRRTRITVSFKLVPDHLRIRAEKYLPLVRKQCQRFGLNVPLVMAIMQTESYFNPRAKSSAPAYGLMQLVPRSGGRDAYKYVYKRDRIVHPKYLYVPENNIELGCAYLAKLRDNEFGGVSNSDNLRLCIVASYNTGPGNVSRSLVRVRNVRQAVPVINGMQSEALFKKLVEDLPFAETRDYLQKVETRIGNYQEWQ